MQAAGQPTPDRLDAADPAVPANRLPDPIALPGHDRLLLHRGFVSRFLPAARDVIVALPPEYTTEPGRRYPVLYLQDGQNLFDPETSYIRGHFWDVQTTSDRLVYARQIEPLIIVGIYNTGLDRLAEYTPFRDRKLGGGDAKLYADLLRSELMPFIDQRYSTLSGPDHTGIGGSSLGGLVSLYLSLSAPQIFGRAAVLSPSVWWSDSGILPWIRTVRPRPRPRIWLDVGLAEGAATVARCDELARLLERRGWRQNVDLTYLRVPDAQHNEDAWAQRVEPMLRFLFPAR